MNIKLHTPTTLRAGSGMSTLRQFLLSLLATTVSIVLTFGTAAIIDYNKKQVAKKEIEMMVINDLDQTIATFQRVDSGLRECRNLQMEIAAHPERFDSLRFTFASKLSWMSEEPVETIEKIFSTSIETFNTVDNANFVNVVSEFYKLRGKYTTTIFDKMKSEVGQRQIALELDSLMIFDFPEYVLMNGVFLLEMKDYRDRCMKTADITEEDVKAFSRQTVAAKNPEKDALNKRLVEEYDSCTEVIQQSMAKRKH